MKKIAALLLAAVLFAMPAKGMLAGELEDKIDDLQGQIDELKRQNEAVQKKVGSKHPLDIYGLVAAQAFMGTARTQLYGGLNSTAAQSRVIDKNAANGGRHTWFSATPQNSRVGLNWTGSKVSEKLTASGLFEIDFVNILGNTAYGASPIPRIRHLYGDLSSSDNWALLFGQTWDLFSPLNTASLSLGNNLWFQGNQGFRRPQFRFTYNFKLDDVNSIKTSVSANLPANTDDLTNSGISSGIPLGEGLVQYNHKMKHGDLIVAASGIAGTNTVNGGYKKMAGVAGSLHIPFHKFLKLTGEVQYGQDMGIFLSYVNSTGNAYGGRDMAIWGQLTSQWCNKFDTAFGYGIDDIKASKAAAGNVDRNQVVFANFRVFPVKPFYVGLEYNYMRTTYKGNGPSQANIIFSNFVYSF
jgi:hypothetical protein